MWTCPKCERPIKSASTWHNCVKVSIDSLFEGKSPELVAVFDGLLAEIIDWPGVAVSASSNCIVFISSQTFLVVRPMKKWLEVKFYLRQQLDEPPVYKSVAAHGKYATYIRLTDLDELDQEVFQLIRQSYQIYTKK